MTTISSLSSADIQSQLTTDESRMNAPITVLNNQAATDKADISAWSAIKGKVASLSSALAGIDDLSTLTNRAATSTSSAIATATVTNSAAVGTYNLTNITLAKPQIIYSGVLASGTKLGASAGSLTFTQNGKTETVKVGLGSLTASGVAKAINLAGGGIDASVVKTDGGARLVLQSSATGGSQAFSVAGTGGLSTFSYSGSYKPTIYSNVLSNAKAGSSSGSLTITQKNGETETVHVGAGSLTASALASKINKTDSGVRASVVQTGSGPKISLQSSATGGSQTFSVSGTGGLSTFSASSGSLASSLQHNESFIRTSAAANATVDINGVPVSESTNTVSSAVSGLTINLAGTGSTSIKVSNSPNGLTTALSSVATSLNAAIAGITSEIKFTPATKSSGASGSTAATAGPLIGNFTATSLESELLQAVSGAEASGLSATGIGLSVSSAGAVSFTSSTFQTAYNKNPTGVEKLVSAIYTTLKGITNGALGSSDSSTGGTIAAQTLALTADTTSITAQVARITKDNNDALNILVSEYSTAEATAQSASITEDYLSLITGSSSSSST
jgi:flagellar hook-associated protein 2